MRKIRASMIVVILSLMSCTTKQDNLSNSSSKTLAEHDGTKLVSIPTNNAPDIAYNPEDAFFPLRIDSKDNKIKPSFQSQECVKKFVVCLKWKKKTVYFDDLSWFYQLNFVLMKEPKLR